MAARKWITLPGGRIKRWKGRAHERGWFWPDSEPHWFRNRYERRVRQEVRRAVGAEEWDGLAFRWSWRHRARWDWW